jgi:hypothetical protein
VVVNRDTGTLKLQVKMNALKDKTAMVVNDLKQLSGGVQASCKSPRPRSCLHICGA